MGISLLHDTHLHLDLYKDIPHIISEIESLSINVIAVTNLPVLYNKLRNEIKSDFIRVALGFHPELIMEYEKYIPKMWKYINTTKYIGEVGLDFLKKNETECEKQMNFFQNLIRVCNSSSGKILSVHSRRSEDKVLETIGDDFQGSIIMHWYSGSLKNLDKAISYGFYFSVNSAMLNNETGRRIINKIPKDRILLESDGPFIKIQKKVVHPSNMKIIAKKVSDLLNIDEIEFHNILNENFNRLF
ncbi:MAG: Qat anti-phage system TatD family nuclease QatD [Thermodesulfobacteriota bacterium]|nr:Qat anti-phage system TatD family nuclease QatD [Thermodesulfobacteriota bacterium]